MKACLVLVVLVAAGGVQAKRPASITRFELGLENIIEKLKHGDTDLPLRLPSLRPLKLSPLRVEYQDFTMDISETTVEGLENLRVERVRASEQELRVYLSLSVPATLVATADKYHLVGSTLGSMIKIDDVGKFRVNVDNLKAAANVTFATDGANTYVSNLDLDFSAKAQLYLSGSSTFLNGFLNAILNDLLADRDSVLFSKAREIVTKMVNQYLRGHTPAELIKTITNIV